MVNQWARWLRRVAARLGGEAGQGGPDSLSQSCGSPVFIDPQGGAQPDGSLPECASEPFYLGLSLMNRSLGQR